MTHFMPSGVRLVEGAGRYIRMLADVSVVTKERESEP